MEEQEVNEQKEETLAEMEARIGVAGEFKPEFRHLEGKSLRERNLYLSREFGFEDDGHGSLRDIDDGSLVGEVEDELYI